MDDGARLQLQKMIKANDVEDQTSLIRELKHSVVLKKDIATLLSLKEKYADDHDSLNMECMIECGFLFTYYTDIYNKIRKEEIDLNILDRFLEVLRQIEEGELDQHEGSFVVGTLLKELYIDSALKKSEKLEKEREEREEQDEREEKIIREEPLSISWKQFKATRL